MVRLGLSRRSLVAEKRLRAVGWCESSEEGDRLEGEQMASAMDKMADSLRRTTLDQKPPAMVCERREGGRRGTAVPIVTNLYGLVTPSKTPLYRYDFRVEAVFSAKDGSEKHKELTKQIKDDFNSIDRKTKCGLLFKHLVKKQATFFGKNEAAVYYDRAASVFTLEQLPIKDGEEKHFLVNRDDVTHVEMDKQFLRFDVAVKRCVEKYSIVLDDFKSAVCQDLHQTDRSLQQFLEILSSQEAFFSDGVHIAYGTTQSYLLDHMKFGFKEFDAPELPEGKYVGIGASKTVRMIEGPKGKGNCNASITIDTKKAAFHVDNQNVAEKILLIANIDPAKCGIAFTLDPSRLSMVQKQLKGLMVKYEYEKNAPGRRFMVAGMSKRPANQEKFQLADGRSLTVEEYVWEKYKKRLQLPNLQCLVERRPGGALNMYPAEMCLVCENQRVNQSQQTPQQVQVMIKACATLPSERLRQNTAQMLALKLNNHGVNNKYLKEANVKTTDALHCNARQLPPPGVEFAGGLKAEANRDTGNWSAGPNAKYLVAAKVSKWAIYGLFARNERFSERDLIQFAEQFVRACNMKGIQIGKPVEMRAVEGTASKLEELMKTGKQGGLQLFFFVQSSTLKLHGQMKAMEAQLQIVTQDLNAQTASNYLLKNQRQTMENIVNKTNLKLGGHNYNVILKTDEWNKDWVWLRKPNHLIIGISASHPPPLTPQEIARGVQPRVPSVIGFAANWKTNPFEFIGDFRYQETRKHGVVSVMEDIVIELLRRFKDARGRLPEHMIIFRDGMIQLEAPAVRQAAKKMGGEKFQMKLTMVIAQKIHNIRFFPNSVR